MKSIIDKIPLIIIIGDLHHNMLGVLRSLGEKGILSHVIAYDNMSKFILKSKYVRRFNLVSTDEEVINILLNKFNDQLYKPIVFCTSDNAAAIIDLNYDKLSGKYQLPNVSNIQGLLSSVMDKGLMLEYAKKAGFKIPQSISLNLGKDNLDLEEIKFPCVVKPLKSIYGKKEDFVICYSEDELVLAINDLKDRVLSVQIQEYLIKDYEMSIVGVVTPRTKTVVVPGIIRKIREYPFNMGSSSYSVLLPEVNEYLDLNVVRRFFSLVEYTGLFSIEFLCINRQLYFLEVNLRNDGNGYVPTKGGCNLPFLYIQDYLGLNIEDIRQNIKRPIYFMIERGDLLYMLKKRLNPIKWIKDLMKVNCFILYDRKDVLPFWYYLKSLLFNKLNRLK